MNNNEEINEQFFATPFWATEKPEWVEHLNKTCKNDAVIEELTVPSKVYNSDC